ncbi:MAG: DNA topoisomerase IB [Actinomycetota bacterium]|nr:DNA topoisomerase IB [Actinomycetota bacterium]
MAVTDDAMCAAEDAGLRYVSDAAPGITRRRRGQGFSYHRPDGSLVADPAERARIEALAVPPAWTDVWICPRPDGHIQATGRDDRGRKQYRYHPRWREIRDANKYATLRDFGHVLPGIREQVDADLRRRNLPEEKVLAAVVRLLDETLIRIGNDEYADANDSYGLTTLHDDHASVSGTRLQLEFEAKSGAELDVVVRDRRLARIVRQCQELPGEDLFQYVAGDRVIDVTSTHVNDYLRRLTGGSHTAKDFRTWGGTVVAGETLVELGGYRTAREADQNVLVAIDTAAERLGNTRAVCRSCYVHPRIPESYRDGSLDDAWRSSRTTPTMRRGERTVLKLLEEAGASTTQGSR